MKAKLFKVDGTVEDLYVTSFRHLQELVGGYVQFIILSKTEMFAVDEEGKLKGKPCNTAATSKMQSYTSMPVVDIVGDAVLINEIPK